MNTNSEVILLTPDVALSFMKLNVKNRPFSKSTCDGYAAAIKRGDWLYTGQPILFDTNGRMMDGQHRCSAVIQTGIPIKVRVERGIAPEAFAALDRGKKRSSGDVLAIAGEKHTISLAASCKAYAFVTNRVRAREAYSFTPQQALAVLEGTPGLRFWVNKYAASKPLRARFTTALPGVLCAFSEVHGFDLIDQFFVKIDTGVGLYQGDPALVLRERFNSRASGTLFTWELSVAMYVKALNAHVLGKKITLLRLKDNEQFPQIEGLK